MDIIRLKTLVYNLITKSLLECTHSFDDSDLDDIDEILRILKTL